MEDNKMDPSGFQVFYMNQDESLPAVVSLSPSKYHAGVSSPFVNQKLESFHFQVNPLILFITLYVYHIDGLYEKTRLILEHVLLPCRGCIRQRSNL